MRRRLLVHGIVQGVGFRPWVHQIAHAHGLAGFVLNSTAGVTIEIEGPEEAQQLFLRDLEHRAPPLAAIDEIREEILEPAGYDSFAIRHSRPAAGDVEPSGIPAIAAESAPSRAAEEFILVPADAATCALCLSEFRDPSNRRYGYPFINCTHCGPRYTIIQDIPYDRPFTTMSEFPMCPACAAEYHDPLNRRFHAEPNACPKCGPWVELWDRERCVAMRDAIPETHRLLAEGRIVAIKGLGGFHLACLASNEAAVRLLRERKRRSDKPFAVMARDLETAGRLAYVNDADRIALTSVRRPIVLLRRREDSPVCRAVAPGLDWIGVVLPYTPLHHLLFGSPAPSLEANGIANASEVNTPSASFPYDALVMTSGNLSEEPIASRNEEVAERLHGLADFFLLHNRKIETRVDDSVVRTFEGRERTLRRSRGFAPYPIDLGRPLKQILACGGELKNVFCLTKDRYALLSQHIGDLENLETMSAFEETLAHMKRFFRVSPVAVAHDLHPRYLSTRLALAMEGVEKIGVQHHHAHVASCMAENRLNQKVIGVAFDGTGYGSDGKIWGGEFLVCDYADFERRFHFRYVPLAGGDTAVRQVWRAALAYLRDAGIDPGTIPRIAEGVPAKPREFVESMIAGGINTVDTSSCGRLFDAVAAILGVRMEANYEGQAAMELEALSEGPAGGLAGAVLDETAIEGYPFDISGTEIDFRETVRCLVRDAGTGDSSRNAAARAAARFHQTLASVILEICTRIRASDGLTGVCLSGGTFQNFRLVRAALDLLRPAGFEVYLHARVPPNDGGLCLGQAVIANRRLRG